MANPEVLRDEKVEPANVRLPDFIVIGAMKSGTTTLFEWLADQPELALPALKEPSFFADDQQWRKGLEWYGSLFAGAQPDRLVGEASVRYTSLSHCTVSAERMAATVPGARLIYLVRHPLDRIRSHYRHWAIYRRGSKTLVEVLKKPDNEFVGRSLYYHCVAPYLRKFPRERICIVRFEDLIRPPRPAWSRVLAYLGLPERPAPEAAYNVSARLPRYPEWMGRLQGSRVMQKIKLLPRPMRLFAKGLLPARDEEDYAEILERSRALIPEAISDPIWEDVERLEAWLGESLWAR